MLTRADRARFGLDDGGDRFEANVAIAIAWQVSCLLDWTDGSLAGALSRVCTLQAERQRAQSDTCNFAIKLQNFS